MNEGGDECEGSLSFGLLVLQEFKIGCSVKTHKVSVTDCCDDSKCHGYIW